MSRMAAEIRELSERIESLGTKQKVLDRAADRAIREVRRERAERSRH